MFTISETEREEAIANGYVFENIAAYVYATQICSSIPLYRLYQPVLHDHFYTIDPTEVHTTATTQNYVEEGIACYVLPDPTD